ncbi:uncharacterized protein AB675_840 [Cyphellophora attinorum]|uniref:Apple domain-containing protein n=1 Tax=Cyphellophora attinorum TaxID=1664694 RepID=A0A0N0NRS9_9EURO|nr:uncharacterized protein AB675_840 [Phialophora attinorum]KPI45448.1 hypothetical protein AB675_840 [Phialophora attinorum]
MKLSLIVAAIFGSSALAVPLNETRHAATCIPLQDGSGPVPSPDSAKSFLNSTILSTPAIMAPPPTGWLTMFTNLNSVMTDSTYLGHSLLDTYDTAVCASRCYRKKGCIGINIFFERAPAYKPGRECPNPSSTTLIKCAYFSGVVNKASATDAGYKTAKFRVVYAGSNGYMQQWLDYGNSSTATSSTPATTSSAPMVSTSTIFDSMSTTSSMAASASTSDMSTAPPSSSTASAPPDSTTTPATQGTETNTQSTTTTATTSMPPNCYADNCLRNILDLRYVSSAGPFCSDYLNTPGMPIATYLGNCEGDTASVTSACSCYMSPAPSTSSSATTTEMLSASTTGAPASSSNTFSVTSSSPSSSALSTSSTDTASSSASANTDTAYGPSSTDITITYCPGCSLTTMSGSTSGVTSAETSTTSSPSASAASTSQTTQSSFSRTSTMSSTSASTTVSGSLSIMTGSASSNSASTSASALFISTSTVHWDDVGNFGTTSSSAHSTSGISSIVSSTSDHSTASSISTASSSTSMMILLPTTTSSATNSQTHFKQHKSIVVICFQQLNYYANDHSNYNPADPTKHVVAFGASHICIGYE